MTSIPPHDVEALPPATMGLGALEGVRVLDLATMMAAPWSGTYLADYGAEVVKTELPGKGDPVRLWGNRADGYPLAWKGLARNKTLVTLALNTEAGQELLLKMLPDFDVVIENFRPGVLERWGLSPERMHEINPRLVILRTSGYGQTGPSAPKPGFGTLAEAMSGLSNLTGAEDRPPVLSGYPLADGVAALAGAMAILAALYWRDASGGTGQVIDNAIIEANYRLIDYVMLDYEKLGVIRSRKGNRLGDLAPRNTYETRDGNWVAISGGTQGIVEKLFTAMERPDLITDPRFLNNALRVANVEALDAEIGDWMAGHDIARVLALLELHEVAAAPVNNTAQIAADPHFQARELLLRVDDDELGPTSTVHVHPRMSRTPGGIRRLGGPIGRDNDAFYRDQMGFDDAEMDRLRAAGAI